MITSLQNMGPQDFLMLMGSKFLMKMTRPQNIKIKEPCAFKAWPFLSKNLMPSTSGHG